jgi:hypothetical protein
MAAAAGAPAAAAAGTAAEATAGDAGESVRGNGCSWGRGDSKHEAVVISLVCVSLYIDVVGFRAAVAVSAVRKPQQQACSAGNCACWRAAALLAALTITAVG